MIRVRYERLADGRLRALACSGHAGFDDGQGLDLVCAAVSALTGALGLGLTRVARLPVEVGLADGDFSVAIPEEHLEAAQQLLETTVLALEELQQHYPGFIRIDNPRSRRQGRGRSKRKSPPISGT